MPDRSRPDLGRRERPVAGVDVGAQRTAGERAPAGGEHDGPGPHPVVPAGLPALPGRPDDRSLGVGEQLEQRGVVEDPDPGAAHEHPHPAHVLRALHAAADRTAVVVDGERVAPAVGELVHPRVGLVEHAGHPARGRRGSHRAPRGRPSPPRGRRGRARRTRRRYPRRPSRRSPRTSPCRRARRRLRHPRRAAPPRRRRAHRPRRARRSRSPARRRSRARSFRVDGGGGGRGLRRSHGPQPGGEDLVPVCEAARGTSVTPPRSNPGTPRSAPRPRGPPRRAAATRGARGRRAARRTARP